MRFGRWVVGLALACVAACGGDVPTTPVPPTSTSPTPSIPLPPAPPAPVFSDTPLIRLISFAPADGGELAVRSDDRIEMAFEVAWPEDLPGGELWLEWLDADGRACTVSINDAPLVARQVTRVVVSKGMTPSGWDCELPHATTDLRVTLQQSRPIGGGRIEWPRYLTAEFDLHYAFREYPRPPVGAPASRPEISLLRWNSNVPTCSTSCFPLADEYLNITCVSRSSDGDALTSQITITWSDGQTGTGTQSFPAGASSGPEGAVHAFGMVSRGAPSMTASCTVTNTRGETVTRTITGPQ